MKITLFLTSIWLAIASWLAPAEKVALSGKISGPAGQILTTASVKVLKNRMLIVSAQSDASGQYRCELDPGVYDVEFACPGFVTTRIAGVEVYAKETNTLNVRLEGSATLEEVTVQHFKTSVTSLRTRFRATGQLYFGRYHIGFRVRKRSRDTCRTTGRSTGNIPEQSYCCQKCG
ncbi:MAG: carboxypeptidase regulatory-like domain-containing protein [Lewinellaceae bacterium]|nr:carboxypeptidase regulatory-like domain-containing protein [Lewinellaceae bacterium]